MSKDSATEYSAYEPPSGRDLVAARGAFKARDIEASRSAHTRVPAHTTDAPERHQPKLTRTPQALRTVRTGYAHQPAACCTYQRHRAA